MSDRESTEPACKHENGEWFDRQICPEPCGSMHYRCVDCGEIVSKPCVLDEATLALVQRRWREYGISR